MRDESCRRCGQVFPIGQTFVVYGTVLCEACGNQALAERPGKPRPGDVVRQFDPTVCHKCKTDGGSTEFSRVAGMPVCPDCEHALRHRPFPLWIKASFVALVWLAICSFWYNWRFFAGFVEMRRAYRAVAQGKLAEAVPLMSSAARHVPESRELHTMADFFNALQLLGDDRPVDALPLLQRSVGQLPAGSEIRLAAERYLNYAESGAAFEKHDYDAFLERQNEALRRWPDDPATIAGVASAHACKYAVSGDVLQKQQALHYLDLATQKDKGPQVAEYRQRILHRLQSREIIEKEEFDRRFPHGWNPEAKK